MNDWLQNIINQHNYKVGLRTIDVPFSPIDVTKLPYNAGLVYSAEQYYKNKDKWDNDVEFRYRKKQEHVQNQHKVQNNTIPHIPEKAITLKNAGRGTGAILSTNMLDSIADNAIRAGYKIDEIPIAMGHVMKETTFGNQTFDSKEIAKLTKGVDSTSTPRYIHQAKGNKDISQSNLISNWRYKFNPYDEALFTIDRKLKNAPKEQRNALYKKYLIEGERYADKQAVKYLAQPTKTALQDAFESYKANPNRYNPGQRNYVQLVEENAEAIKKSPQYQEWFEDWKKRHNIKRNGGIIYKDLDEMGDFTNILKY